MKGFKKVFEGEVIHESGYGISFERNKLKYWNNEKILYIPYESNLDPYTVIIFTYGITNWYLRPDDFIKESEKNIIIKNIDKAISFLNIKHEFNDVKY